MDTSNERGQHATQEEKLGSFVVLVYAETSWKSKTDVDLQDINSPENAKGGCQMYFPPGGANSTPNSWGHLR